jgi:hypothetical protein
LFLLVNSKIFVAQMTKYSAFGRNSKKFLRRILGVENAFFVNFAVRHRLVRITFRPASCNSGDSGGSDDSGDSGGSGAVVTVVTVVTINNGNSGDSGDNEW